LTGTITANAVIVPAGTNGRVDVFTTNDTDLVIDINGYFAPAGLGGLSFYGVTPCRVLDTRLPSGTPPFSGTRELSVSASSCGVPATAQSPVLSATVVPPGALGYITLWPQEDAQPLVATLNAVDGAITSNMAIVPAANDSIDVFASAPTHLVLDIFGYFAEDTSSIPKRQITFASAQSFNSGVARPGCVATEDFNGDGYRDFVVTDHIHSLAVFLGKGDGTFREPMLYTLDFYVVGCVAVGDFNGDGKMDVVVGD
jgi:hypothetical protein